MKYYKNAKPGTFRDASGFEAHLSDNGTMNNANISKIFAFLISSLQF